MPVTLHGLCGKIAAGKSTLARRLAEAPDTILISEDNFLSVLYGPELKTIDDYDVFSARLRAAIGSHIVALLRLGVSVVLDFPANTVEYRAWMRSLFEAAGSDHRLHVLEVPDDICLRRLRERNLSGDHPYHVTDDEYAQFTRYFVPPRPDEGFDVVVHAV